MLSRSAVAVLAAGVLTLSLSGCSGASPSAAASDKTPPTSPAPTKTAPTKTTPAKTTVTKTVPAKTATVTVTAPASASAKPSSTPVRDVLVAECSSADVRVTLGRGDGAAGTTYFPLVMTNVSDRACRSGGYGGVSLVGGGNGTQIGSPAQRFHNSDNPVRSFVLIPGAHATATLGVAQALNYPSTTCRPEQADGLRVYVPNETHSQFVPATGLTGCRSTTVRLLTLMPYQPVS